MPSSMPGPGIVTLGADGMTPMGRLGQPREVSPAFGEQSDSGPGAPSILTRGDPCTQLHRIGWYA